MNPFWKLLAAGFTCAVIVAGTLAANANVATGDRADRTIRAREGGVRVALNPQPLPPIVFEEEDYGHFDW